MRLRTIWTLPGASLREKTDRTGEWLYGKIANKIPQRVKYWVVIQELAKATRTSENVPATPLEEILNHLEKGKK